MTNEFQKDDCTGNIVLDNDHNPITIAKKYIYSRCPSHSWYIKISKTWKANFSLIKELEKLSIMLMGIDH
jgi:hypothetical protein